MPRLYVSTPNPGEVFILLITYIVKVCCPVWFAIRRNPSCCDGARHLYMLIQLASNFPDKAKRIVFHVVQTNGFYAHPENILISMINDEDAEIRELGWRRIKKKHAKQLPKNPSESSRCPRSTLKPHHTTTSSTGGLQN